MFTNPPASPEAVAALESAAGVSLPADYRAALLEANGGRPDEDLLVTLPDGDETVINSFFGAGLGGSDDIWGNRNPIAADIPPGFLPIADDPGGDILLLACTGDDRGAVHYFYHDRPAPADAAVPGFPSVARLAPSFEAFLAGLRRA